MREEKIRVFVSIDIPKHIGKEIKKIQRQLPFFKGKFTALENLHLTLKFLGEIDKETLIEVKRRLKEVKFKKFEARISKLGIFDNRKSRKYSRKIIVWVKLENCNKLQKEIDEKLSGFAGFEKEHRFMSHVTIARVKNLKNKNRFLGELKKIKFPLLKFKVEDFKLKKSELFPEGPVYETLESYRLS